MRNLAKKLYWVSSVLLMLACGSNNQLASSKLDFDSAHTIGLLGEVDGGVLYSSSNSKWIVDAEIGQQLMYAIGQFNGENGGIDINQNEISIKSIESLGNEQYRVQYAAKMFVAWPRDRDFPESYRLKMPARGDSEGLERFFELYGDEKGRKSCLDGSAHDVSVEIFWYYYRPESKRCQLRGSASDGEATVSFPVRFSIHEKNTNGKSPEYHKIWEDNRFVATAIFGKNEEDGGADDAGTFAYNSFYHKLVNSFGEPIESNVNLEYGEDPSIENPELKLAFATQVGRLEVNMFLIRGIRDVDDDFKVKYNKLSEYSDYVVYNGHSGLGANIRALAKMGNFIKGQYQIYFINGCDTFAYVDDALTRAHLKVNPNESPNKYIDLITNAMPSFFHSNANVNIVMIKALVEGKKTYQEIFEYFDKSQRANVVGEEDND